MQKTELSEPQIIGGRARRMTVAAAAAPAVDDNTSSLFPNVRSFVRVRPFTAAESKICPENSPVPRGIIERKDGTVLVLDAQNRFKPRRNGVYPLDNILWSFYEPDEAPDAIGSGILPTLPGIDHNHDVYRETVKPILPSIVQGYPAAFLLMGAPESGKSATMYGSELDPNASEDDNDERRGIVYRFCRDIFSAFADSFQENANLAVEVELVEFVGETPLDLLNPASHRAALSASRGASTPSKSLASSMSAAAAANAVKDDDAVKVVMDSNEGVRLQGVQRANVNSPEELETTVRNALKNMKRRKSTHTIQMRFTETFEFQDPANPGQSVTKARRISVLFALMRTPLPPSFHRCIDVAIERDSGESPNAVVPTRESLFTKLYADLFSHGYHTTFITCISPFVEHAKDAVAMLQFATKIRKIRCTPKQNHDESLVELRKLADEVKGLKTEVIRQNENMQVVQEELNRREEELMRQENMHADQSAALQETRTTIDLEKAVILVIQQRQQKSEDSERQALQKLSNELDGDKKKLRAVTEERRAEELIIAEETARANQLELKRSAVQAEAQPFQEKIAAHEEEVAALQKLEDFIAAEPEERQKDVADTFRALEEIQKRIPEVEMEKKEARSELGEAKIRHDEVVPQHNEFKRRQENLKKLKDAEASQAALEKEVAALEAEDRQMKEEIDKAPKGCCLVM